MGNHTVDNTVTRNMTNFQLNSVAVQVWLASLWLTCAVGALTSILLLIVIVMNSGARKGYRFLVAHMLVLLIVYFVVHYPAIGIFVYADQMKNWRVSNSQCNLVTFPIMATGFASNWTDLFTAFNRVVAVVFPAKYKTYVLSRWSSWSIGFVWIISLTFSALPFSGTGGHFKMFLGTCNWSPDGRAGTMVQTLGIYFPFTFVGISYFMIFLKFFYLKLTARFRIRPRPENCVAKLIQRTSNRRFRVAGMLFLSFLCYSLCYLPFPLMKLFFEDVFRSRPMIFLWLRVLLVVGQMMTPVSTVLAVIL